MEINLQGGVKIPQALPGARSADFPVKAKTETATGTARVPDVQVDKDAANAAIDKRLEQISRAAENFFKEVYAVSDARFTIFKDSTGQYITRYTSLRDGRVTYIPEPQMLQYMERRQQARQALVEIQA